MTETTLLFSRLALLASLSLASWGTDFSFFTTMRAGFPGSFAWELGAGSTSATTESRSEYEWNGASFIPHWRAGDLPQNFQIGYSQSTGTGFVRVFNISNTALTASFTNPGAPLIPGATWTLPSASFFATANSSGLASSVNVENMSFSPGVQILSGSLPASLGASYSGSGPVVTNNLSAPIVFNTASSGGDWTLSGTVRFNGLFLLNGNSLGDQLRFGFGAIGSDASLTATPESSSVFLIGGGLIALGCIRHRRKLRNADPTDQSA